MAFSIRIDKENKVHLRVLTEEEMLARTEEEIMRPIQELPVTFERIEQLEGFVRYESLRRNP